MMDITRDYIKENIMYRLGHGLVDVELDEIHLERAIDISVRYYRQRSSNSMIEAFAFIEVQSDVATYTLPSEIQEVRAVYRRNIGGTGNTGSGLDPFSVQFTNSIFLIQNPGGSGGLSSSGVGSLATYDMAAGYEKLAGRMFGRDVQFTFDTSTKRITFHRRFIGDEEMGLHVYTARTEESLFSDPYAGQWLEDMALAQGKLMLGQGRGKWSAMAGPQGGVSLNGAELKAEGQQEITTLMQELKDGIEAKMGLGFTIG